MLLDFEYAALKAVREAFPGAQLKGCYFHLGKSFYGKIRDSNLEELYASDEELRTYAKCFKALAFVPVDNVVEAFEELAVSLLPTKFIKYSFKFSCVYNILYEILPATLGSMST